MIRKLLLTLGSIFLAYQVIQLLIKLNDFNFGFWLTFFLAFIFNLLITGVFAFLGFAFPTQKLLPERYYTINQPKKIKATFKIMKVDAFRTFLLATFWRDKEKRNRFFDGTRAGFQTLEEQSMKAEFGHLIPFILLVLLSLFFLFKNALLLAVLTFLINSIFNLYPIILQRHHRMRISILKKRQLRNRD